MPKSDTWRLTGFEADIDAAQLLAPVQCASGTTPVVYPSASTGYDLRTLGTRGRYLLIIDIKRTAQGMTYTVTESATTNGTYAAATTSGSLAKVTASGVQHVSVKYNPAKPFIRVTATGDNAASDVIQGITVLRF